MANLSPKYLILQNCGLFQRFTPTYKYYYTDVSAMSATFRNSIHAWRVSCSRNSWKDHTRFSLAKTKCYSFVFLLHWSNINIWKINIILQLIDEVKYFAPSNKCASYLQLHSDWTNLTLIVFWKHKHNMFREAPE